MTRCIVRGIKNIHTDCAMDFLRIRPTEKEPSVKEDYLSVDFFDPMGDDCRGDLLNIVRKCEKFGWYSGRVAFIRFWFFIEAEIEYRGSEYLFTILCKVGKKDRTYCGVYLVDNKSNLVEYNDGKNKDLLKFAFESLAEATTEYYCHNICDVISEC
jgi:hypothetical protein